MNQQKEGHVVKSVRRLNKIKMSSTKSCTLCRERFHSPRKFTLFCNDCKEHSESYRFADWLST